MRNFVENLGMVLGRGGAFAGKILKVTLDERYFRRMEKFEGDKQTYRSWRFDFLVAVGQVGMIRRQRGRGPKTRFT